MLFICVGVNGSGKSRLLQTIAEIFLSLDPNFGNQQVSIPDFPVTLAYDLGKDSVRTVYLRHQENCAQKLYSLNLRGC
ncbi:MAG: hypothetical protein IPK14_16190 [Blastocatellia bacterium]|nr:hypothetical protein [Blastocatellia bacterium]